MPEKHVKFHSSNGKRLVLIIDDEEINRLLLSGILEEDYELLTAADGAEALRLLHDRREMLSLVLLDLILPDLHGFDILREMRAEPDLSRIPVIVMTSDRASEVESLMLGASDFIPKPYPEPKIVQARVRRTIELSEDRNIIQLTERDSLTGLYNKEFFFSYAEQFDQHHRDLPMDAVVLDINHFRMVNERYGKAYGDEVLKRISEKLREVIRDSGGIVCRREADTFLIYCPHRDDYMEVLEYASEGLAGEENVNGRVHLRLGIYSEVDKSLDMTRRFDRAKIAADTVRGSYTKAIAFYDKKLHEAEIYADQLIEDFPSAIAGHQFQVYYQPKFDIQGEQSFLSSAEALVRWMHPQHGMISPGVFIPLFEKNGLIEELDAYVWNEAARQMKEWKARLGKCVPVSVNVSRIDMYDPELTDKLKNLINRYGLSAGELLLEITESAYTQDSEQIIETVNHLRNLGFRIEMDDFGTGYSSLNMISTLPIDALKLDMMFIRNAFIKKRDTRIIEVIIDIAEYLSVPVIAEGVETEEQVEALKRMGCSIVQGYYFSKPVPPPEFEIFLTERMNEAVQQETSFQESAPETEENPAEESRQEAALAGEGHSVISEIDSPHRERQNEIKNEKGLPLRNVSIFFAVSATILAAALFITNAIGAKNMTASGTPAAGFVNMQSLLTILLLAVVLLMAFFVAFWVRRPLIRMVENMKAGKYVEPSGAEELRFVSRTYNEIFEENQKTNEKLTFEAMHDALTGLLNRNAYQVLEQDVDTQHSALLIIDVDKFKSINDVYGHLTGDKILKRVAETLQHSFRSTDMIFRIGGDEFVVIMSRANSSMRELVLAKIDQINAVLQNPEDGLPPVSLSVGVAFGDRRNPQGDLLRDADTALFRVKEAGRCGCVIY